MRKPDLSFVTLGAAALLAALLVGCPQPGSLGKPGALAISINNNINAKTLLPPISMDAASYTIEGEGPHNAAFSATSGGEPVTVDKLAPGTWTVTVKALNADTIVIGQGREAVDVVAAQTVTLSITVTPLSGMGSLSLSVSWNVPLDDPSIQASLAPSSGPAINLDFGTITGSPVTYSNSAIPAGYYTLTLQLLSKGSPAAAAVEVARIVAGQTTTGACTFDVTGALEVRITPALANPIPVSISGVPGCMAVGTSVTATVSASDGTANAGYTWYLNGVQKATGPSFTFGSDLRAGRYRLDVTAFADNGTRGGSATVELQVGATPFSIVGSWTAFRAWAAYMDVMQFRDDKTFTGWEDYAETDLDCSGTWSVSGDTLTLVFTRGGPGAGATMSCTLQWDSANQVTWSSLRINATSAEEQAGATWHRKGFEPDGYLFNNPKYPPLPLVRDATARGTLASDGLALYQYIAGPNAQNTVFLWTGPVEAWVYANEETLAASSVSSPVRAALTPNRTYFVVVGHQTLLSGDYSIVVMEADYVGTWADTAYDSGGPAAKLVMTQDSITMYTHTTDPSPSVTASFTLSGSWTDGGAHYFQLYLPAPPPDFPASYILARVSNNNTLEVNVGVTECPTSIDPNDSTYGIWTRQ